MAENREIVLISDLLGHTPHVLECIATFFLNQGYTIYHLTDKSKEAEVFFPLPWWSHESMLGIF
jgi:hypothetical protein